MRVMLRASIPVESGNRAVRDGSIGKTIQSILEDLKAEAAYFCTDDQGRRSGYIFLEIQDASQIPAIAEPWFLAFNASVDISPAMNAKDLANSAAGMEKAVKKYGSQAAAAAR